MSFAGGAGMSANQLLVAQISAERQRRSRRWRLAFLATWAVIVAGLVLFILVTVNVDTAFLPADDPVHPGGRPDHAVPGGHLDLLRDDPRRRSGALGRLSRNPYLNGIASFYVSFFRGTPLLLQILFIYLALPQAGIVLPAIPTAIVALSLNYGSYMTEVFRSGIEAVPHGQTEAAQSLGMTSRTTFRRIIAPAGVPHRDAGRRQRLHLDDQGLVAGLGGRRPGDPVARPDRRAARASSRCRRCWWPRSSTGS